jgi:hypothetical protein
MRRTQEPRGATDAETLTRPISLHKGPGTLRGMPHSIPGPRWLMLVGNNPIPELILLPRPPAFAKSRPTDPCCSTEADDQHQLNHPPDGLNRSPPFMLTSA